MGNDFLHKIYIQAAIRVNLMQIKGLVAADIEEIAGKAGRILIDQALDDANTLRTPGIDGMVDHSGPPSVDGRFLT